MNLPTWETLASEMRLEAIEKALSEGHII